MPKYKLTYFDAKGRAEFLRMIFAQAGVDFEDHRIKGEQWMALKPNTPTGQLPILEIDGKQLAQSMTIARYLGREYNLLGANNLEMAYCEQVMDTYADIGTSIIPVFMEKDEAKKAEMKNSVFEDKVKPKLKDIEKMLVGNGGEYFVGKKLTVADIMVVTSFDIMARMLNPEPLKDFPKLAAHREKVMKEPKIAAWIAKRPQTAH